MTFGVDRSQAGHWAVVSTDGDVDAIASGMYTVLGCARKGDRRRGRATEKSRLLIGLTPSIWGIFPGGRI